MTNPTQTSGGQTQKCSKCQEDIQPGASKCKHCGADLRNWFIKHKILTGVLALFVIVIVVSSVGGDDSSQVSPSVEVENKGSSEEKEIAVPKVTEPEISVTSAELTKAYADNEVAADAKYKDKLIEVSGTIAGIDNGILDSEMIVRLSDGEYDFSGPYCYTNKSEYDKVLKLTKGQEITMIGKGDSATIGSPVLKKCIIK